MKRPDVIMIAFALLLAAAGLSVWLASSMQRGRDEQAAVIEAGRKTGTRHGVERGVSLLRNNVPARAAGLDASVESSSSQEPAPSCAALLDGIVDERRWKATTREDADTRCARTFEDRRGHSLSIRVRRFADARGERHTIVRRSLDSVVVHRRRGRFTIDPVVEQVTEDDRAGFERLLSSAAEAFARKLPTPPPETEPRRAPECDGLLSKEDVWRACGIAEEPVVSRDESGSPRSCFRRTNRGIGYALTRAMGDEPAAMREEREPLLLGGGWKAVATRGAYKVVVFAPEGTIGPPTCPDGALPALAQLILKRLPAD